jgi:hypothetical protein
MQRGMSSQLFDFIVQHLGDSYSTLSFLLFSSSHSHMYSVSYECRLLLYAVNICNDIYLHKRINYRVKIVLDYFPICTFWVEKKFA